MGPWEFTLGGRVGYPTGQLKVADFALVPHVGGTSLSFRDLGINVSEALEGSVAFSLTPRDAVRGGLLYYFLDGSSRLDSPVFFNGVQFGPGQVRTNADFFRFDLAYERTLLSTPAQERLVGSIGVTFVTIQPTLTGQGMSNTEILQSIGFRQALPVPILGLRWDHPLGEKLLLRTSIAGGALPLVDSTRQEGGTLYVQQSNADASARLVYAFTSRAQLELGYHFTYFYLFQTSHEDKNIFELIDNGAQLRFTVRF